MIERALSLLADAPEGAALFAKCLAVLAACHVLHLVLRAANPRWRVVMWRAGLVATIALPLLVAVAPRVELSVAPAREAQSSPSVAVVAPTVASTETPAVAIAPPAVVRATAPEPTRNVLPWILAPTWLALAVALLVRTARSHAAATRLARRAAEAPGAWMRSLDEVRATLGIARKAHLRVSDEIASPLLCGAFDPAILVPDALADDAAEAKRRTVLAHELAHLRGGDVAWFAAFEAFRAVLWFVPLAWWMPRLHERACEEVADAVAAEIAGGREPYARTLAQVALDAAAGPRVAGTIPMAARAEIVARLERLKKTVGTRTLRRRAVATACVATLGCAMGVGGLRVARAEQTAPAPVPMAELPPVASPTAIEPKTRRTFVVPLGPGTDANDATMFVVRALDEPDAEFSIVSSDAASATLEVEASEEGLAAVAEALDGIAVAQPKPKPVAETLAAPIRSIIYENESLAIVLKRIADLHGLNIVFDPNEQSRTAKRSLEQCQVTIRLSGMTLADALTAILETHGYSHVVDERGFVRVVATEKAAQAMSPQVAAPAPVSDSYTDEELAKLDVDFLFARIGDPEQGRHGFSPLWALEKKYATGTEDEKRRIVEEASRIAREDGTMYRRWICCYVLSGTKNPAVADAIGEVLLNDDNEIVRSVAAEALGMLAAPGRSVELLKQAQARDQSARVQETIAKYVPKATATADAIDPEAWVIVLLDREAPKLAEAQLADMRATQGFAGDVRIVSHDPLSASLLAVCKSEQEGREAVKELHANGYLAREPMRASAWAASH